MNRIARVRGILGQQVLKHLRGCLLCLKMTLFNIGKTTSFISLTNPTLPVYCMAFKLSLVYIFHIYKEVENKSKE